MPPKRKSPSPSPIPSSLSSSPPPALPTHQPTPAEIARHLLAHHGILFSETLGLDLAHNSLDDDLLFQWLVASVLYSARIRHHNSTRAAKALFKAGFTNPQRMAGTAWEERVRVLNENGYARYDESTSRYLGDLSTHLLNSHSGSLLKLRAHAHNDPVALRTLLKQFKGLSDVGVDIFLREAQLALPELFPFLDAKAAEGAKRLGMINPDVGREEATQRLLELACETGEEGAKERFVRLVAALVRVVLEKKVGEVVRRVAEEGEKRAGEEEEKMNDENDRKERQRRHTKLRRDARGSQRHFNDDDDASKPTQRTKRPRYKSSGHASKRFAKSTNAHEANIGSSE
ncbi:hypothetical protein BC937DRAFT_95329 [Endogone sp. FLAS-F59071]|nr:hypothetical protein BC937DRAFT_95329 [Endogone sp. FLAS-F59071]|eukprot:RUS20382.1 hypothetical protein BC937DRAFT_95329 [Endogone sp. FLAS-F59071]